MQAYRFGAELGGTGGEAVGDATLVELVFGDFDDPGDFRRHEDSIATGRVGNSDFDGGARKMPFTALETETSFGHVFAGDDFVGRARPANAGFVIDLGARVFAPVVEGRGRFALRRRTICRGTLRTLRRLQV